MSPALFLDRLNKGEKLISDGATGTNLIQRGLPRGAASESWVIEKPNEIVRLHQDFIQAGAQIILTCTFGANTIRLGESEQGNLLQEINQRAVELARKAADGKEIYIAASIGPLGKLMKPYGPLSPDEAIKSYREQIQELVKAGIDLLVVETQFDLAEANAAIQAARSITNLPLVVSFSYDRGTRTMMGVNAKQMAKALESQEVDVLGINCGRSLDENLSTLKELRQSTNRPIWFKPNAGIPAVDDLGNSTYTLDPQVMGEHALKWLEEGASVIGGCCGTSPAHLSVIASSVLAKL